MKNETNTARVYFIIAKNSNIAVIFRRGPSKLVQISKWNLDTDQIEFGQWFKGMIYESHSDISPDGDKLIYFCSKFNYRTLNYDETTWAWTALSKLPYLHALCLWPQGPGYKGGGTFLDNETIFIDIKTEGIKPIKTIENIKIIPLSDKYDFNEIMKRKGWKIVEKGIYKSIYNHDYQYLNQTSGKYIKYNHNKDKKVTHEVLWYNPKNYGNSTIIEDLKTGKSEKIEDVSCIAWDKKDRLVFAKMGCIYYKNFDNWDNELLYDFNSEHFTEIIAPDWAKSF